MERISRMNFMDVKNCRVLFTCCKEFVELFLQIEELVKDFYQWEELGKLSCGVGKNCAN